MKKMDALKNQIKEVVNKHRLDVKQKKQLFSELLDEQIIEEMELKN